VCVCVCVCVCVRVSVWGGGEGFCLWMWGMKRVGEGAQVMQERGTGTAVAGLLAF